jgi:hypothetical protein
MALFFALVEELMWFFSTYRKEIKPTFSYYIKGLIAGGFIQRSFSLLISHYFFNSLKGPLKK